MLPRMTSHLHLYEREGTDIPDLDIGTPLLKVSNVSIAAWRYRNQLDITCSLTDIYTPMLPESFIYYTVEISVDDPPTASI